MIALKPGTVVTLTVARLTDIGAFLDTGTGDTGDDILLHRAQQTRPVQAGERVAVYLYHDPHGRLAASMRLPRMREGQVARCQVINVDRNGAFVDIGAERGVLLPFAEMRGRVRQGDRIWVKLYRDKSGRPAVTMKVEDELRRAARPAETIQVGDTVTGTVYNVTAEGAFLFTAERYIVFLHHDELVAPVRIGEEITARVTHVREDGRLNASQRPLKETARISDAEVLLEHLQRRGGLMPYSDATPPSVIRERFHISKAAFKRALGKLLKDGLIEQRDGWTYLKKDTPAAPVSTTARSAKEGSPEHEPGA